MNPLAAVLSDISPDFTGPSKKESRFLEELLKFEGTGEAIKYFAANCRRINDYTYWFGLGTLWVNYSGWSDLELWKHLFRSPRRNRDTSLMKPSELRAWKTLPEMLTVYRAHRLNETDWISYALDPEKAALFALQRGVGQIAEYIIRKPDALCLFLRRGETEVLLLDKQQAEFKRHVDVVVKEKQ